MNGATHRLVAGLVNARPIVGGLATALLMNLPDILEPSTSLNHRSQCHLRSHCRGRNAQTQPVGTANLSFLTTAASGSHKSPPPILTDRRHQIALNAAIGLITHRNGWWMAAMSSVTGGFRPKADSDASCTT